MEVAKGEGRREEGSTGGQARSELAGAARGVPVPGTARRAGRKAGGGAAQERSSVGGAGGVSAGESKWRQWAEREEVKCKYRVVRGTVRLAVRSIALLFFNPLMKPHHLYYL